MNWLTSLIPGFSWLRAGLALAGAAALAVLIWLPFHWKGQRDDLRLWQADVLSATRLAADSPKLGIDAVIAQINDLGRSIENLRGAITVQNRTVADLGAASLAKQSQAKAALAQAQQREDALKGILTALDRDSAKKAAPGCPSAPSVKSARNDL